MTQTELPFKYEADVVKLNDIVMQAGEKILSIYHSDFEVESKQDSSPVTEADTEAEKVIIERLQQTFPEIPVIAEEQFAAGEVETNFEPSAPFFLVDPLDGTREFIAKNGEFTVNIALIVDSEPVAGVVYLPVLGQRYYGFADQAYRVEGDEEPQRIFCRSRPQDGLTAVVSRSHMDEETESYLSTLHVVAQSRAGSSLKLCRIAEGCADVYPRFGRTMEWDIAAGHAVIKAAGGAVKTADGEPLNYGKPGFSNPAFIAWGLD